MELVPQIETVQVEAVLVEDKPQWKPDPKKRVAIVGFAGTTRGLVPYDDPTIEIWSLNNAWQFIPKDRWASWFELHPMEIITRDFNRKGESNIGTERYKWLAEQPVGKPIYMQRHYDEFPASIKWPREEINSFFAQYGGPTLPQAIQPEGYYANDYHSSSISEMLAHAIYLGYGEIHVYGVDMLQDEEYYYQRAGCEYYIGFARGAGIKVYMPPACALCRCGYVYGFTEPPATGPFDEFNEFLDKQEHNASQEKERASFAAHLEEGRLQSMRNVLPMTMDACEGCGKIRAWIAETTPKIEAGKTQALAAANLHEGARQAFMASKSWGKHSGRGGKL